MKIMYSVLLTAVIGLLEGPAVLAVDNQTPETLLTLIYKDHQPWTGRRIAFNDQKSLSKYFDDELIRLFVREENCKSKTRELCNLVSDPIYCAQDFGDSLGGLSIRKTSSRSETYEVSFNNLGKRTVIYVLRHTPHGWKVSDIRCPEGDWLKKVLSRPIGS